MDVLNLQPDVPATADSTFEIEGYQDHIEEIEQAYPEEDFRTPVEKGEEVSSADLQQASDDAFKPDSVAQTSPLNVSETPGDQTQTEAGTPLEFVDPVITAVCELSVALFEMLARQTEIKRAIYLLILSIISLIIRCFNREQLQIQLMYHLHNFVKPMYFHLM